MWVLWGFLSRRGGGGRNLFATCKQIGQVKKIKFEKAMCAHGQLRVGVGGLTGANGSTGPM